MTAPLTVAGRLTTALLNQFDFTAQLDSLAIDSIVDQTDVTTFGNQSHVRAPHNLDAKVDFSGFYDGSTASSFNRVVESLLGTYGVVTCSHEGNAVGASAHLISGIIANDNVDAKAVGVETTKLAIDVSNPVNATGAPLTPLGYDVPAMNFGKLLLPPTIVTDTNLNSSAAVSFFPVDPASVNQQVVVHGHLLAVTGATTVSIQYSTDGVSWTTAGNIFSGSVAPTSVRAAFSIPQAAEHFFRVQYQGASQPYTLAVALALGASTN